MHACVQVTTPLLLTLLLALLAVSNCRPQRYDQDDDDDAKYQFQWSVDDEDYDKRQLKYGHKEARDGAHTRGQYYILLPDTRLMRVEYYADDTGYHPTITFEGTAVYPETAGYARGRQSRSG